MSPLSTESAEKVRSLLEEIARLDDAERVALLDGLGLCAAIRPWADAGASTVELPRPSRAVPLEPVVRNSACGAAPAPAPAPDAITGCPWCRRPVSVELGAFPMVASASTTMSDEPLSVLNGLPRSASRRAYVTLLYGKRCSSYFLGALVLAHGLRAKRCCDDREAVDPHEARRILMHTAEVPAIFLQLLRTAGWELHEVEHAKAVSFLFRQGNRSRFRNVFTKLRALKLPDLDVVMLLDTDLLIRHAIPSGQAHGAPKDIREPLSGLFDLRPPAAMLRARRGCPEPSHGERLPYTAIWSHPEWRKLGDVPVHQQACGINAGVMVLRPDPVAFEAMEAELRDWFHPEHYTTMMPEQEYLGRFYGTFDYWTHMDCKFNFEVRGWWPFTEADGEQGPPVDYGNAHEAIRQGGALGHPGAVVLHFSGHWALTNIVSGYISLEPQTRRSSETVGLAV
eukprot:TRINITY_DN7798_c2_g2_i2.p1 TRINITY_DN7798_c2_g2~~TRINITY_DN7798_c2_g2_i2.p1  ORF type:complete len:463 (+),score=66.14 TRINITY_DN7798_c2_g2_i2:33-1391(+)